MRDDEGTLDTHSFTGNVSGLHYPFCPDGVFCDASNTSRIDSHLWGYYGTARIVYGLGGHVFDLPPTQPQHARAMVDGLIADGVLEDAASRMPSQLPTSRPRAPHLAPPPTRTRCVALPSFLLVSCTT